MIMKPVSSLHHVTPLSNLLLGRQECNKLKMDHNEHIDLHKICDADKYTYQEKMDRLYAQVNNDLVLSLDSVNALYEHL